MLLWQDLCGSPWCWSSALAPSVEPLLVFLQGGWGWGVWYKPSLAPEDASNYELRLVPSPRAGLPAEPSLISPRLAASHTRLLLSCCLLL